MARTFVRIVAGFLIIPIVGVIWLPAIATGGGAVADASIAFRALVVILAIWSFATFSARKGLVRNLPGFLAFPLTGALNPFDLVLLGARGFYCPAQHCAEAQGAAIALEFLRTWGPVLVMEVVAFAALLVAVRVAAGKMWPGSASR